MNALRKLPNDKSAIYSSAICGLVLLWHSIWIISFGSQVFVVRHFANVLADMEDSNFWLNIFGRIIPFAIFILVLIFAQKERAFRLEHQFKFWTVILLALSPGFCAIIAFFFV